jgi:2-keto-4-pentenoate hydratase/2-oxohepta-3-ene-1,7-dioic acid hydratase in catechol pathway
MKYCRFELDRTAQLGMIETVAGREMITRVVLLPSETEKDLDELPTRRIDPIPFSDASLLPATLPSKIICIGRNYAAHARELGNEVPSEPLIFLKPPSSIIAPAQPILRPPDSERVDHEGELGVIIGRRCRHLPEGEDSRPYIRGYTCVNDVTARDLQKKDSQWTRGKGFDTFCPVGPVIADRDELDPVVGVEVECRVNGDLRQRGNTRNFIFSLDAIIRFISRVMTLYPGDLIATGTPEGVGPLQAGDVVEVSVEGVGRLSNPVMDDAFIAVPQNAQRTEANL